MSANIILTIQSQVFSLSANILAVNSVLLPFFVSLALLALSINMIRWFRYVKLKYNHGNNEQEDIRMILCSVCAVCYYIFILGDWLIFYAPKSTSPTWTSILGYNYLTMYSYLMAGTILMISIISNRIIKKESLESKVSNDWRIKFNINKFVKLLRRKHWTWSRCSCDTFPMRFEHRWTQCS